MRCWVIGCEVMHRAMWQDVELSNEAEYVDGIFVSINPIILKIKKKLIEVAKKIWLPKFIIKYACSCFTLDHLDYRLDENNYIILTDNRVNAIKIILLAFILFVFIQLLFPHYHPLTA